MAGDILAERKEQSQARIAQLQQYITEIPVLQKLEGLCIYATGSYGRLEASEHSDIDLFFIHRGEKEKDAIPQIKKTLLDARLIELTGDLGFPEFSNDGEFLTIHYLSDICNALGSREDDYHNYFTARMLLLLESRPLYNKEIYNVIVREIIRSYYRDFHDHETTFRPIFLINDILRFWKTLCLNYENKRNNPTEDEDKKNKAHLRNFKLKFSRLLTCFSAILLIARNYEIITPKKLSEFIYLSPLERMEQVAKEIPKAQSIVVKMKQDYEWFLDMTGREPKEVLIWIGNPTNRAAIPGGRQNLVTTTISRLSFRKP
jgi:nucleotidyltransferase-like protein